MKVVVQWSGGKDSQASLIWAVKKYGAKNVQAVFCDTGWEHELTYHQVEYVAEKLGVELIILRSKKYNGFLDLAKKKKRFPSTKARFCTEKLKIEPFIDWMLDNPEDRIIIQGIRSDESEARSLMDEFCTYFRYYFEPYDSNPKKLDRLMAKKKKKADDYRKIGLLSAKIKAGKLEEKYMSYRKKDVVEYVKKWVSDIIRPVISWTAVQVVTYILDNGQKPNPLYYLGFSRVGCFPCVMCRLNEIKLIAETSLDYITRLQDGEKEVGRTFFPPEFIPKRFASKVDQSSGVKVNTVDDVVSYVTRHSEQVALLPEEKEHRSCMSAFMICD